MSERPRFITKRTPLIGGKIWCCHEKGLWVLEPGPAVFRTVAVTHNGSGGLTVYDGVPDENGSFPDYDPEDADSNGSVIFEQPAATLGSWMLDGGCNHGLTVLAAGGTEGAPAFASFVWMPHKKRVQVPPPPTEGSQDAATDYTRRTGQTVVDVVRSAAPGALMRSARLGRNGMFRLSRRTAEFYSVQVKHAGAFGVIRVLNAHDETLWMQPSAFTGSFVLGGEADGGLLVELHGGMDIAPLVNVNWREPDQARV
jgi:hypothetical protein